MVRMPFVRALRTGLLLFVYCIWTPAWGDDMGKVVALKFSSGINRPHDDLGRVLNRSHRAVAIAPYQSI